MALTGECFCGEVKYAIKGELRDARSCHCSRCRKVFSSQASAYAIVESQNFEWLSGQTLLSTYVNSDGSGFKFCSQCGSTLVGTYHDLIHGVTLGCINGDPGIELGMHLYVGSKANWETIPEGVIQYQEGPPDSGV